MNFLQWAGLLAMSNLVNAKRGSIKKSIKAWAIQDKETGRIITIHTDYGTADLVGGFKTTLTVIPVTVVWHVKK